MFVDPKRKRLKQSKCLPGCGLDFHKRCAFRLANTCSRARRQISTSLSLFPTRRPRTHSLSNQASGSLEEVRNPPPQIVETTISHFCGLSTTRSACRSRPPGRRPGLNPWSGWAWGMVTDPGRRSPTPSTSTATPNPPCASTAASFCEASSDRACSVQVRGR